VGTAAWCAAQAGDTLCPFRQARNFIQRFRGLRNTGRPRDEGIPLRCRAMVGCASPSSNPRLTVIANSTFPAQCRYGAVHHSTSRLSDSVRRALSLSPARSLDTGLYVVTGAVSPTSIVYRLPASRPLRPQALVFRSSFLRLRGNRFTQASSCSHRLPAHRYPGTSGTALRAPPGARNRPGRLRCPRLPGAPPPVDG